MRAFKAAGFNEVTFPNLKDIIMVSEPEAAAIYTARYLNKDKEKEFFKAGLLAQLSLCRDSSPIQLLRFSKSWSSEWSDSSAHSLHIMLAAPARIIGA